MIVDVLSESINNPLRFLLGWCIINNTLFPPSSLLLGYWMGGAFLMTMKRFAEYRFIGNSELAAVYRRSFRYYTQESLLICAFFYAICSVFFIGIFLIKYKIEMLLFIPFMVGLFCYYLHMAFKLDSAVQKPEKLYREKKLILYSIVLVAIFCFCMWINIPSFTSFLNKSLVVVGLNL